MTAATRPPIAPAVIERLKAAVGPAGYIEAPEEIAPYVKSWRGNWVGRSPLLVRPASTAEMAEVVRICAETDTAIVPQGGNTGLTYGSQPGKAMNEVIVSTMRMKAIRAVDLDNDTITVEAGVVLQEIQRKAAELNRLFPLSLGAEGTCQIGGNISTNAGGIQVLRYGNMRNLVLGLEVVLPDGRVWDGLRGLRKDNTGYDLKHLFIGGEGTLGIVTAAVLKLFPRPTEAQTAFVGLASAEASVAFLAHMRQALGESVTSFELISRPTIDLLLAGVPGHSDPFAAPHPWYVLTEVTGQGEAGSLAEPLAGAIEAALERGLLDDAVIAQSGDQSRKLWRMREDLPFGVQAAGGAITHDVSVPLSRLPDFIRRADAAMGAAFPGVRFCCFGHVGDGNMHYNPVRPTGMSSAAYAAETPRVNKIVHDIVVDLGGSISAEHGIGVMRREENLRYKSAVEIDLMAAVKRALDPQGIMNPGKVVP